jgi:hypothetical protein
LSILRTDDQFDKLVRQFLEASTEVLIDPMFDMYGKLVAGLSVQNYYDVVPKELDVSP